MLQETAKILWSEPVSEAVYRIGLTGGVQYAAAEPGQFVTLRLPGESTPLLRRPFSIHRVHTSHGRVKRIEILYKTVGDFTRKLARQKKGDALDLLGPLGHGFTASLQIQSAALVAGGIGVAPMVFLAEKLKSAGTFLKDSVACLGGRSAADILCAADFQAMGIETQIATEDGSLGEKGLVTEILAEWLKNSKPDMIYACGPVPMLDAVSSIARQHERPCEVSIETIMACGVGACLGCAIKDTEHAEGYGHVCIDGPVFKSDRVLDDRYRVL